MSYSTKYNCELHEKSTHQEDVIRSIPVEFLGGVGKRTHFKRVKNILSKQRPAKPENGERVKKSIIIYKLKYVNPTTDILPNVDTQLQELKEKYINALYHESQQHGQGIKYMTVMELVFKRLTLDKEQYEWMHQPTIYNSKMQELVYGTSKDEIIDRMQDFSQKFWDYAEDFQSIWEWMDFKLC